MNSPYIVTMSRTMALALAVSTSTAMAQSSAEVMTLEEVVITAQKRVENLQEAPLAVTALSSDDLIRSGVKDINNIAKVAPELFVTSAPVGTVLAIRGVRSNSFGPSDESANAIHINGAYMARFQGLRGSFYDVQRVEIAAGPQGTLYGRSASGGTMNIITNKPGHEFGGNATLDVGNYNLINMQAALNLPVTDTLALRLAGMHYKHDGYYKDSGLDDADQNSGRASLLWNITDRQSLLVIADNAREGGKGSGTNIVADGPPAFTTINQSNGVTVPLSANTAVSADGSHYVSAPKVVRSNDPRANAVLWGNADRAQVRTELQGLLVQHDADLGFATLTTQGSYHKLYTRTQTGTTQPDLQPEFNIPATFSHQRSIWRSAEIRLTSAATEPLKWVGGVYYFNESLGYADNGAYITNSAFYNTLATPSPVPANPFSFPGGGPIQQNITNDIGKSEAYAAFGEVTWSPISSLHLTGGLRYNHDEKYGAGRTLGVNGVQSASFNGKVINGVNSGQSADWSKVTSHANVAFDITDVNHVYVNFATGYKAGGFAFGPHPEYEPETITAYEVGSKNEFLNKRLKINSAAWYYKYKDYETAVLVCNSLIPTLANPLGCNGPNPATNPASISVVNAGSARTYGASLSAEALVFSEDVFKLSVQYLDAKYEKFDLTVAPFNTFVSPLSRNDFSNTVLGQAAKWTATSSYDKVIPIGDGQLDAQVAVQYQSERLFANQARPGTAQYILSKPATTLDVSLRYAPSKAWDVTGYVNNVTDKVVEVAGNVSQNIYNGASPTGAVPQTVYFTRSYGPPRTFGVILGVKF